VCWHPGLSALQVVEKVLAECGQDIDAAIRRLNQLKLSTEQANGGQQVATHAGAAAAAAPDNLQQQQQQQAHAQQEAAAAAAAAAASSVPQTADQWVDALVQEMATAKDVPDARNRAGKLLQAFEQFVTARSKAEVRPSSLCLPAGKVLYSHVALLVPALQHVPVASSACHHPQQWRFVILGLHQLLTHMCFP
jgi:hypothetical protein